MVFLFRLLSRFPLPVLHFLGGILGWLTYLVSPTYRRHLRANMAQAGFDAGGHSAAIAAAGRQSLELARTWMAPIDEAVGAIIEVRGKAFIDAAQAEGKGILFITPHLGSYELTALYLSTLAPLTAMYRPPRHPTLRRLIEIGRNRPGLRMTPADLSGVRALIKALRRREWVGILPDQTPQTGEGQWLDFFGRPAYTMTLAARLSETGAATLFIWGERLSGGRGYRLHVRPALVPLEGDTTHRAQQINHEVEALIRECPAQYLWGYNRYKRPSGAEPPPASPEGNRP